MDRYVWFATVVVTVVLFSGCHATAPRNADPLADDRREEIFKACYMNMLEGHESNVFVDRIQAHQACSKYARARVPR